MKVCTYCCLAIAIITLAGPMSANAESEPGGMVFISGAGAKSCGETSQIIELEKKARPAIVKPETSYTSAYIAIAAWLDGYLSAKNEASQDYRLVGQKIDRETRMR